MGANKQICRLCLEVIPDNYYEDIDDIKIKMMDILLIDTNLDISDHAIVCNMCWQNIQSCFGFKSTCFYVDDYIVPFVDANTKVDIRKVFEKEASKENVNLENCKICRLCLSLVEEEDCASETKNVLFLEDMLVNCLPEVDLNAVLEPLICKLCLSKMNRYYEFKKSCQEVEQRIKEYFGVSVDHGVARTKELFELVEFKTDDTINKPLINKIKFSSDGENGVDVTNDHINEKSESIQSEEIDIKDESDGVEMGESNRLEDISSSEKIIVRREGEKGKQYYCPKCSYSAKYISIIKCHMRRHSDSEVHRCNLCNFITDARLSMKAHMTSHRGLSMAYGCSECTYETNKKPHLVRHLLQHKDQSELEVHKCPLCSYESKYKNSLRMHRKRQHCVSVMLHQCNECSFSSKYKGNLLNHKLTHKNPAEIPKYRCAECGFETKKKSTLRTHIAMHYPDAEKMFQCMKCPFKSRWQVGVQLHMKVHADQCSERCDECTFTTAHKFNLVKHKQRMHPKDGEKKIYKCPQCNYQAKTSITIKDHMHKAHMESSLPIMKCPYCPYVTTLSRILYKHVRWHNREYKPMLKCELCPYVTWETLDLQSHSLVHGDTTMECNFQAKHETNISSREIAHKCDLCAYHTKLRSNLKQHRLKHMAPGEITMYFCATCDYRTKYKYVLRRHVPRCLKTKTI